MATVCDRPGHIIPVENLVVAARDLQRCALIYPDSCEGHRLTGSADTASGRGPGPDQVGSSQDEAGASLTDGKHEDSRACKRQMFARPSCTTVSDAYAFPHFSPTLTYNLLLPDTLARLPLRQPLAGLAQPPLRLHLPVLSARPAGCRRHCRAVLLGRQRLLLLLLEWRRLLLLLIRRRLLRRQLLHSARLLLRLDVAEEAGLRGAAGAWF